MQNKMLLNKDVNKFNDYKIANTNKTIHTEMSYTSSYKLSKEMKKEKMILKHTDTEKSRNCMKNSPQLN